MRILPTPAVGLAQKGWKDAALWALRGGTSGSRRASGAHPTCFNLERVPLRPLLLLALRLLP